MLRFDFLNLQEQNTFNEKNWFTYNYSAAFHLQSYRGRGDVVATITKNNE